MYTISNILEDICRGCARNNLNKECFSYRIVFFVNENGMGTKHYSDSTYEALRRTLETIIRENSTIDNTLVIAAITTLKGGKCVSLLSRSYGYSLDEYFQMVTGKQKKRNIYSRYTTAIYVN